MKKLFLMITVISTALFISSCTSKSAEYKRQQERTRDSIAQERKLDSLGFCCSQFLAGDIYFEGSDNVAIPKIQYGFVWSSDHNLSIVMYSNIPGEIVPLEIAEKVKTIIHNKYNSTPRHIVTDTKPGVYQRVYLNVGKVGDFTDPLDEASTIIKIIVKETKWQVTKTQWCDPLKSNTIVY